MAGDKDSPKTPPEWRTQDPLGKALRDQYKQVLNEPVPENLQKLIEKLKRKEKPEEQD